jgi:hypothetical protein
MRRPGCLRGTVGTAISYRFAGVLVAPRQCPDELPWPKRSSGRLSVLWKVRKIHPIERAVEGRTDPATEVIRGYLRGLEAKLNQPGLPP